MNYISYICTRVKAEKLLSLMKFSNCSVTEMYRLNVQLEDLNTEERADFFTNLILLQILILTPFIGNISIFNIKKWLGFHCVLFCTIKI